MSFSMSQSQTDYLISLILQASGYHYFLPGVSMNPLDRLSLPNDELDFVPLPLFEGRRQPCGRSSSLNAEYLQALASFAARMENLENEFDIGSAAYRETLDESPTDLESRRDVQSIRRGITLPVDSYREMDEDELRAHHRRLNNYRITYRQNTSISTNANKSPRTVLTDRVDRDDSSGHRVHSDLLVSNASRMPTRSVILEPLSIDDFVKEHPWGEIETFYGSIYGIMFSDAR